jgi:membrane-associated protease RseP (regulator of RpoE activity)
MTSLYYLLGVVLFAVLLLVSIGLHEFGHLVPAKLFGAKVPQWFIGFGPTLWSIRRRGTEYGVKAAPLGGYVRIVGMVPSDPNLTEEDEPRAFYRLAWWKKVVVMAGGPTVNLLIAFALFSVVFGFHGVDSVEALPGRPVVAEVSQCVIPYSESGRDCTANDPVAPAHEAGLRPGDVITSFNGTPVTGWDQLRTLIQDNAAGTAVIGYERDGVARTGTTSTTVEARPTSQTDFTLHQVGFLGVSPKSHVVTTKGGPVFTIEQMGGMIRDSAVAVVHLPQKVWGVAEAIVGVKPRAADSPMSIVGGGRVAGETASATGIDLGDKLSSLLALGAGFNLFIGILNFVPLLPLDGGHIASALWEAVRRGLARLRRRPDPGFVDAARLLPIAYVVGAFLLVMGAVLIVGDIVVPVNLPS